MPRLVRWRATTRGSGAVDFDGSMSAIRRRSRRTAHLLPGRADALAGIIGGIGTVAVVSGRPVSSCRAIELPELTLVGQLPGLERW